MDVESRRAVLKILKTSITEMQDEIAAALKEDLGKSESEAYMCEIGLTLSEISNAIKHIRCWSRKKYAMPPLTNFPSKSYMISEPYGNVLIMSPWNYPFLLSISPLIYALAAGNTAVIKPSAYSPATSAVIRKLIEEVFTEDYVAVVEGGREVNSGLLEMKWDYIFFTGSKAVGKVVMGKAAEHLTPVTLELGGKSPVIVDETADIKTAAARIVFGKYLNLGQTCVAPDHLFVHESVADALIAECKQQIVKMFGVDALDNGDYGKIISEKHYARLRETLADCENHVIFGGRCQDDKLRIEPTIISLGTLCAMGANIDSYRIMQEEIFGPLLPIISYRNLDEVVDYIDSHERPLATYIFTTDKDSRKDLLSRLHFGGGCVNDTIVHLACDNMPFGGVGESGMGNYHGKWGFETFSHTKSIVDKANWLDLTMRYQPYGKFKLKLIKLFLK